ncbi:hypothetical protein D3C87_1844290 [compost metagenome]
MVADVVGDVDTDDPRRAFDLDRGAFRLQAEIADLGVDKAARQGFAFGGVQSGDGCPGAFRSQGLDGVRHPEPAAVDHQAEHHEKQEWGHHGELDCGDATSVAA